MSSPESLQQPTKSGSQHRPALGTSSRPDLLASKQDGSTDAGTTIQAKPTQKRRDLAAMLVIAVTLTVLPCIPLLWNPHFYFFDDTAGGAYGQWFELGHQLAHGHIPLLNLDAWMAGNYSVEQFGLLNPVIMGIGLATQLAPNAAILATLVKIFFLVAAGLGTYLLARSLGARRDFAMLAGIAAPLGGFTLYIDAATWVTNLEVWAYFPWFFWGLRRFVLQRKSYWPAFLSGYLIITVNYVQGAIMLVLLFAVMLVDSAIRRDRRAAVRTLFAGLPQGLLVVAIFLPAILSSGVTTRAGGVNNSGLMTLTLNGLAVSSSPFASPDMSGMGRDRYAAAPYTYIAWFLPMLLLCEWHRMKKLIRPLFQPLLLLLLSIAMAAGPSQLGALRFPIRTMPWVVLLTVTVAAVAFSRCLSAAALNGHKLAATLVAVALVLWLSFSASPNTGVLQLIPAGIMACYVLIIWWTGRRASTRGSARPWLTWTATSMVCLTILTSGAQLALFSTSAEANYGQKNMPSHVSSLEQPVPGAIGETIMLGDGGQIGRQIWTVARYGNLAYLSRTSVINLYSPVGYDAFNKTLCLNAYYGVTCYDAATTLFTPVDEAGGSLLVDLMGLDTVQFVAPNPEELHKLMQEYEIPQGWSLHDVTDISFLWRRDSNVQSAGLPTWATEGLHYTVVSNTSTQVKLHIDEVPSQGGQVVFSRLAWPGYTVKGGDLTHPVKDFLLRVEVPAGREGQDITVTFRPPGWHLEVGSFTLAWLLAFGCAAVRAVQRRKRSIST